MPAGFVLYQGEMVPKVLPVNAAGKIDDTLMTWSKAHPYAASLYKGLCTGGKIKTGQAHLIETGGQAWALLPVRETANSPADSTRVEQALTSLIVLAAEKNWRAIAVPSLGDDISHPSTRAMLSNLLFLSSIEHVILYDSTTPLTRLVVVEHGDILASGTFAIVIPVHALGHANKGLVRRCAKKYPDWEAAYLEACETGMFRRAGYTFPWTRIATPTEIRMPRKIIAAATTAEGGKRKMAALTYCIARLQGYSARTPRMTDIAIPAVHSGFAGIAWPRVKDVIEDSLESWAKTLETIYLYPPYP